MKQYTLLMIAGSLVLLLAALSACAPAIPAPTPSPSPSASPIPPTVQPTATPEGPTITGKVVNTLNRPLEGAVVRIRATENKTRAAADGTFTLYGMAPEQPVMVTAWSDGYFINWEDNVIPGGEPLEIMLKPYYTSDNPEYTWFEHEGATGSASCSHCMPSYNEWIHDAHSQSAINPRFLSMYNGTDMNGNLNSGPGYMLDFPDTPGVCVNCHAPLMTARAEQSSTGDPNLAIGIEREGIFCEFCHKIGEVALDTQTGLPNPDMPGMQSIKLYRPNPEQQLFFANFDDVARRVSYNPLYEQSQYCAPCHYGVFHDTVIYNSFGEWLESPYSNPETGKTCQACHMPTVDYDYFVLPEKGGLTRDRSRIVSHLMPGASDEKLLQNSVTMNVETQQADNRISVVVEIINDQTGHHIPTDSPLRQMILLVQVEDSQGNVLPLVEGDTIPEWGGTGDPEQGYFANLPGKIFAKLLMELATQVSPTAAYWNPTRLVSDTRIPAFGMDTSTYVFEAPTSGTARITVTLLFRRAYKELMDQKGWEVPDIVMEQQILQLP